VSDGKITVTGVGGRYASALFDLAREENSLDSVENNLDSLANMLRDSADLNLLIRSPALSREDKQTAILAISKKAEFSATIENFLGLVARNGRLDALPAMISDYRALLRDHRGELTAQVTSALKLTDKQLDDLKSQLKAAMGRDVQVDLDIDPELIGGLVVKVGSRMIDSSLRTKLDNLHLAMKEAR